jgi:membrane-associated protein
MNFGTLFDPNSIVADLGLIGILAILFAETGLLVGLAFPGDSLLFIAGLAASGSAAALLGGVQLSPVGPLYWRTASRNHGLATWTLYRR